MEAHVIKFLQFLEAKEGKNVPLIAKLLNQDKFKITKDDLNVKGSLNLSNTTITSLPDGLRVSGYMFLHGCTSLESLPNGLEIGGSLDLEGCTSLTSLPNGLYVGRSLYLDNTPLAKMYSEDEVRAMIEAKGGYVGKNIHMTDY